jgi:hypothetical protein
MHGVLRSNPAFERTRISVVGMRVTASVLQIPSHAPLNATLRTSPATTRRLMTVKVGLRDYNRPAREHAVLWP